MKLLKFPVIVIYENYRFRIEELAHNIRLSEIREMVVGNYFKDATPRDFRLEVELKPVPESEMNEEVKKFKNKGKDGLLIFLIKA